MTLSRDEEKILDLKFKGIRDEIKAKDDLILQSIEMNSDKQKLILNQILCQTQKTNGRVTELEEKMLKVESNQSLVMWFKEKPVKRFVGVYLLLVIPIFVGMKYLPQVLTLENLEKILKLVS